MPQIDWTLSRLKWHNLIGFYSGWSRAALRRTGAQDRACVACVTQFTPVERRGGVVNPEDMKARVSALQPNGVDVLEPEPDKERDRLIVFNPDGTEQAPYRLVVLPRRQEPMPGVNLFWTLQVRR
jgi:hypothetical protein